jgi:ATP-binding cassette, subfamily C, bacterial CydD
LTQSVFSYEKMAEGSRSTVVNPSPHKSTLAKTNTNSKTSTAPRLEATDLTAAYEGTQASYAPISFQLQQGQTLVITGPSGVGKTTLLLTLAGFMTPHQGRLKNTCLVSKDMNFLPQQPWIIQGSWAENLQVLAPQSTRDQMLDALRFLGFSEHLQRQNEPLSTAILDRPINDHGDGLSGGQLRRLAFARVLLAPKSMIFLDEPTASLDEESRGYVIKALKHLQTHCVMVIASHDSDVLSIADQHRHLAVLNKAPAHA